jgi:hypothetical protein
MPTMIDRIAERCPELEWDEYYIGSVIQKIVDAHRVEITNELAFGERYCGEDRV